MSPGRAPATGPGGTPPDTVFLEELTWAETRDLVKGGWTSVIIGTAGTEQKGPHMVDGEHKFVMTYTADKIARGIGRVNERRVETLGDGTRYAGRPDESERTAHDKARHAGFDHRRHVFGRSCALLAGLRDHAKLP